MKKLTLTVIVTLVLSLSVPPVVFANMGPPERADVGSSITFDQNDTISVLSEILDITVDGPKADIVASYKMKNITDKSVITQSMFLSPNINNSSVAVTVNGKGTPFETKSYVLNYDTKIETDNWQYIVLTNEDIKSRNSEQTVNTITFDINFAPNEEFDVVVSYTYRLGGYPDVDFNAKTGRIEYYLTPASMWNEFGNITINLKLDEDMPVIASSNLDFKKIGTRTFQYVSDTLPKENLEIVIDESWWQNIFSTMRSPYFYMTLSMLAPFILTALAIVIFVIWRLRKKKNQGR